MLTVVLIFIIGLVIGSFLNVCIHRMPLGQSLLKPGSHCPKCNKAISWYDNIPLLSYILLRGRCRYCQQKISPRYFMVELITGALFVLIVKYFGLANPLIYLKYIILVSLLIVATFVDIQHRIIPDEISIGGIVIGFLLNIINSFRLDNILGSLMGIIVGGGIIYLTGFLFDIVYFKLLKKPPIQGETSSMGGGDVKLLAMIGAFLGWQKAVLTFFIAPFFGAVIGIANLAIKKDHTIPYGPFLSLAALLSIFWADNIIRFFFA
ncbi:prepilin peptidase [bacterium]|nr:MAG: prepilin peptidase [bacterium]